MAWDSTKRGTSKNCFDGVAMKLFFYFLLTISFLLCSCSKTKEEAFEASSKKQITRDSNNFLFSFDVDTTKDKNIKVNELSFEKLSAVFPKNIFDLRLDKINKGNINISGTSIKTVSAEYVSKGGLIVVYVYDYLKFSNLPEHLRSLFELTRKDEIINLRNGVGCFNADELSRVQTFEYIYLNRFHIKIEAINYPNFRESALDIVNNLNLGVLAK
jgi:hypothetical protein